MFRTEYPLIAAMRFASSRSTDPFTGGTVWKLSSSGWRLSGHLPLRIGEIRSLTVTLPNQQHIIVGSMCNGHVLGLACITLCQSYVFAICSEPGKIKDFLGSLKVPWDLRRCFSAVESFSNLNTIEVLHNNHAERIRLNGIDCPEKGQAYGKRAKQAASALVFGKEVTLRTFGTDKYGRTIADVLLPDETNVNHTLVKDGWCWWYRKYAPGNVILAELERGPRVSGLGLWADPHPVPPWEWWKRGR